MNRKAYWSVLAVIIMMGLTNCSSKSNANSNETIAATSGSGQSATVGAAFGAGLVATVTSNGKPVSGVAVTFSAPGSGASGTFANGMTTETDTTSASGVATSTAFTANTTAGGYSVSASTAGASAPTSFSLTNNAGAAAGLAATVGATQSALINTSFGSALGAQVVDSDGNPVADAGVTVTFSVPASSGGVVPSGTFNSGAFTETDTTNASGLATSSIFTANGVAGSYVVTASASPNSTGVVTCTFNLTNTTTTVTTENFTFYMAGQEAINDTDGLNFVALSGVVTVNTVTGAVTGGVQDYNDAFGITSPQPNGDGITGGQLTVSATTGQGTLSLNTNDPNVGVGGVEKFAIQFVNGGHALITQFDGTATSSGSMDLQTLPNPLAPPSGSFAFTSSGVDPNYAPVGAGGVLSFAGTALTGIFDVNDDGTVTLGEPISGTVSGPDGFGRGSLTGTQFGIIVNYYIVGPEAIRVIVMDADDAAVGSAFGQGLGTFTNASLQSPAIFGLEGDPFSSSYATLGMFTTSNTSSATSDFAGLGDDNELLNGVTSFTAAISGTYSLSSTVNGYGSFTVTSENLGDVFALGIYMTDPTLNLSDPNNTSSGQGGALILDLDDSLAGGTGVVIPQTTTATSVFAGPYAVGMQDFNVFADCEGCEFDLVGQGTATSGGALSGFALISDPFFTLDDGTATISGIPFSGIPLADTSNPGRYLLQESDVPSNPLVLGEGFIFDMVIYQANGGQLFWLETDEEGVLLGPLEQQGSLTGLPAAKSAAAIATPKSKH